MKLSCIVIDDEPPALHLMQKYIIQHPSLELVQLFDDAVSASEFLRQRTVDILFVDINMPDITGLDLVKSLEQKPMIIFTTAYKKFAADGFELDAVDYLVKPISTERFLKAVHKALDYHKYKNKPAAVEEPFIMVFSEYKLVKIVCKEIEFIESMGDYIRIHLIASKPVMTLSTMKEVLDKLPVSSFQRIHRSYIAATDKIKTIAAKKVITLSGVELPVGDSYADVLKQWKKR